MGNIVEAGFGDTRAASDDEDYENCINQNIDSSQYTYRNGVNYIKETIQNQNQQKKEESNYLNN